MFLLQVYAYRILGNTQRGSTEASGGTPRTTPAKQVQRGSYGNAVHNPRRKVAAGEEASAVVQQGRGLAWIKLVDGAGSRVQHASIICARGSAQHTCKQGRENLMLAHAAAF